MVDNPNTGIESIVENNPEAPEIFKRRLQELHNYVDQVNEGTEQSDAQEIPVFTAAIIRFDKSGMPLFLLDNTNDDYKPYQQTDHEKIIKNNPDNNLKTLDLSSFVGITNDHKAFIALASHDLMDLFKRFTEAKDIDIKKLLQTYNLDHLLFIALDNEYNLVFRNSKDRKLVTIKTPDHQLSESVNLAIMENARIRGRTNTQAIRAIVESRIH